MNKTLRIILIVIGVIAGAAVVIAGGVFLFRIFGSGIYRHPMMVEGYRGFQLPEGRFPGSRLMVGYGPLGFLGSLLFRLAGFGLLVALIVLLIWAASRLFGPRRASQTQTGPTESLSVQDILARRYASGEISREEYLQILEDTGHKETK